MQYALKETKNGLALTFENNWLPLQIDFQSTTFACRLRNIGRNELIAKAIGWRKNQSISVLDATAGLGIEAFIMASLGCELILLERNPTIFALLKDGLERANQDPALSATVQRMQLFHQCAIDFLNKSSLRPDVIYCDPMFEARQNTALVKKEMQVLQNIVGFDRDAHDLVSTALQKATKRVVVKRAIHSEPVVEKPSIQYKTKTHRFDVYVITSYRV